ncbi:MAG: NAD(+) synthase [Cellulomonadaceae bacterium]|jgi:NAD+ synthase (glutamine-hydrolysing)|nr:NAD(+) synthase [Cellulomonadaceae bacterium]
MNFWSAYAQGFARVAAVTVPVTVADPQANARAILEQAQVCHDNAVAVAVFPELSLTGYAIDDLFLQDPLLESTLAALADLVEASKNLLPVIIVGAPLLHNTRLLNCAVVIHQGRILGVAPKSYLPNYREFYERRWFQPGDDLRGASIEILGTEVPLGPDLIFTATDVRGLHLHVEVCEDMWVPIPPSSEAVLAGATVLANLSASPITVARADTRQLMVRSASARGNAAYIYAAASPGESSTDLSWDGQTEIYECGDLLGESERFPDGPRSTMVDVDVDRLRQERQRQASFDDNRRGVAPRAEGFRRIAFTLNPPLTDIGLLRPVDRFPFVPDEEERLALDCYEAYNIQVSALVQRIRSIGAPKIVIGVSGGLDSTHALIVAAKAMDLLGRPRSDILGYTMPGFATGAETKDRAWRLGESLGVSFEEIDIRPAATQMLKDMGHPFGRGEPVYDVTFENVQAGLRTDYLFRLANHLGGIVLGTGDLSELALGWATYGVGDQMSHYGINVGVPKTLIQHLIRWVASTDQLDTGGPDSDTNVVLREILDQEISPELVPADADGALQSTQAKIGPYPLQDFNLYWLLRYGIRPSKIAFLSWHAWHDAAAGAWPPGFPEADRVAYDLATIKKWLELFVRRFFSNQFKRTCIPNGPKVLPAGTLSPRGDWRMPSDASAAAWLADLQNVPDAE